MKITNSFSFNSRTRSWKRFGRTKKPKRSAVMMENKIGKYRES